MFIFQVFKNMDYVKFFLNLWIALFFIPSSLSRVIFFNTLSVLERISPTIPYRRIRPYTFMRPEIIGIIRERFQEYRLSCHVECSIVSGHNIFRVD